MSENMSVDESSLQFRKIFVVDDGNGVGYGEETKGFKIDKDGSTLHHCHFYLSQVGDFWPKMSDFDGSGAEEPDPVGTKEKAIKMIESTIEDRRKELASLEKFLDNFKSATGAFTDRGIYWSFEEDEDEEDEDEDDE